jgi:transposase
MEAYPQKIRELVLDSYEQGKRTASIAKQFKVSRSWTRRVKQRWQELQLRNAIEQKHGPDPKLTEADRLELAKLVKQTPDATLKQFHEQLNKPVSVSTIVRALNDMKLTLKKSPCTPANRIGRT